MNYKDFKNEHKSGARIKSMSSTFDRFVEGTEGKPSENPIGKEDFLLGDVENINFLKHSQRYTSHFARHASASIPFIAEGDCRLGAGIFRYANTIMENKNRSLNLQELAGADGGFSRTLANLSQGKISTLTNSATYGNYLEFLKDRPKSSYFWSGPFFEITPELIKIEFSHFQEGFDIIYEHIIFQMYSADRDKQIEFVSQNLKSDGILLLQEKNKHVDAVEYLRREEKKDRNFKLKYFSEKQMREKKEKVLNEMEKGEITLDNLASVTAKHFRFVSLIWSSCNFNLVAASNSQFNLESFIGELTEPCMPMDFCFEQVPQVLFGKEYGLKIDFRPPTIEQNPVIR